MKTLILFTLMFLWSLPGLCKPMTIHQLNNGFVVEISPEFHHFQVNQGGHRFDFWDFKDAGINGRIGQPWLPVQGVMIFAPAGTGLKVQALDPQVIDNVLPGPIPRLPKRSQVFKPTFSMGKQAYSLTTPWPASRAWLTDRGIMRGVPVARLVISPMTYSATRSQVTIWHKIKVTVTYPRSFYALAGPFGKVVVGPSNLIRGIDFFAQKVKQDRYLVIVADDLEDSLSDWVKFRQKQGVTVDVVPTSIAGRTWDKIKDFIHDRYFSQKRPDMVLLVGDSDQVPPAQGDTDCAYCPSDYLYSLVEGADWYADLAIGRWSAQTPAQVIDQANKDMMYETAPGGSRGPDFLGSALVISSSQGDGVDNDDVTAQKVIELLEAMKYRPLPLFHSSETDTVARISGAINRGTGLVYYYGHGSGQEWDTTSPPFTTQDVSELENNSLTPFIMDVSCLNGDFTRPGGDCLAEAWVHGGGLASFSSTTDTAWMEPVIMANGFTRALQGRGVHIAGAALAEARTYMIQQAGLSSNTMGVLQQYLLFGDPGQVLYTKPPVTLDVGYLDPAYKTDSNIPVTVKTGGVPVENALVTLNMAGKSLRAVTGANGKAILAISTIKTGSYTLFIRAENALPFYGKILVKTNHCPYIQADKQVCACSGSLVIVVMDSAANQDPAKKDTVYVNRGNGRFEAVETGPDTGIFRYSFTIPDNTQDGQKFRFTYPGHGECGDVTASITTDCQAPACEGVAVDPVKDDRFGILCRTNEPARLRMKVNGPEGFTSSVKESRFSINHHIMVRGLMASTTYNYLLRMEDTVGNTADGPSGVVTTVPCQPKCLARKCGDDLCGGQCGLCFSDQACDAGKCVGGAGCVVSDKPGCDGCPCEACTCKYNPRCCGNEWDATCVDVCQFLCKAGCGNGCIPQCKGMECGSDGCGGVCGQCTGTQACFHGKCVDTSRCGNGICDPDENCVVCPKDCACANNDVCMKTGECCARQCKGRECGPDGCGGECGTCTFGKGCVNGHCVRKPRCGDGICDPDENCSSCAGDCVCEFGTCKNGTCTCLPLCEGRECGPDQCGGTCGKCGANAKCVLGSCLASGTDRGFMPDIAEPKPAKSSGGCTTSSQHGNGPWVMGLVLIGLWLLRKKTGHQR